MEINRHRGAPNRNVHKNIHKKTGKTQQIECAKLNIKFLWTTCTCVRTYKLTHWLTSVAGRGVFSRGRIKGARGGGTWTLRFRLAGGDFVTHSWHVVVAFQSVTVRMVSVRGGGGGRGFWVCVCVRVGGNPNMCITYYQVMISAVFLSYNQNGGQPAQYITTLTSSYRQYTI